MPEYLPCTWNNWKNVTSDEIKAFLSVIINMGVIPLENIEDYRIQEICVEIVWQNGDSFRYFGCCVVMKMWYKIQIWELESKKSVTTTSFSSLLNEQLLIVQSNQIMVENSWYDQG